MQFRKTQELRAGVEASKANALSRELDAWLLELSRRLRSFELAAGAFRPTDASWKSLKLERAAVEEITAALRELTREIDEAVSKGFMLLFEGDDAAVHLDDGRDLALPAVGEELVDLVVKRSWEPRDLRVRGVAVDGHGDAGVVLDPLSGASVVVPAAVPVFQHFGNGGQDPEGLDADGHSDAVDVDFDAVEDFVEVHESSSSVGDVCGDSDPIEGDSSAGEGAASPSSVASSPEGVA